MKTLGILVLIVIVAAAVVLGIASTRPDTFSVERSIVIQAPAARIYPLINDFHAWPQWSPWEKLDPTMKRTYSGEPRGILAVYAWQGDGKAGEGRMKIVEAAADQRVGIDLTFVKPFPSANRVVFMLTPEGGGTRVTWTMSGASPFMAKVMGVFVSMDRMVGGDFDTGLANLKAVAEKAR